MKKRYKIIPRSLILVTYKEYILLQKGHAKKIHWANMYNALGGHIEQDEDIHTSATRELREESGISISPKEIVLKGIIHVHTYLDERCLMFIYHTEVSSRYFEDSSEGKLEWIKRSDLKGMKNIAEDIKIFAREVPRLKMGQIIMGTSSYSSDRRLRHLKTFITKS